MAGPDHGYDLHQRFTTELGSIWHLSQSQAYAILKRLEARGDISAERLEQPGLPARQRLRITPAGRRRFMAWLVDGCGENARSIRLEFLTRLYFSQTLAPESLDDIYSIQVDKIEQIIARLESLLEGLPPDQPYNRLSLDLRLRQMLLIRQWVKESRQRLILGRSPA